MEKNNTLNIEGMTCAHCAMTITKVLENNGAENATVNYAAGEASFHLPDQNNLQKIISGISKAGYKVVSEETVHAHEHTISRVEKYFLFTLPLTIVLFLSHMIFPDEFILNNPLIQLAICFPVFTIGCLHFGKSAWSSVKVGAPNMDVLVMLGSGAAFVYSVVGIFLFYGTSEVHNYLFFETAATIITLILLGNVMEHRSVKQTTSAIGELSKLQITTAKKIMLHNGKEMIHEVSAKEILTGDVLMVNTGDKIPVDGAVLSGNASIDESMITGESVQVEKSKGDKVIGGTIAAEGNIKMLAEKIGKETVLSKIIEMVKSAQQAKPKIQKLGDKISNIFVPVVLVISVLTFLICHFVFDVNVQKSLMNSIAVLVISCPCAMGLATPTAVMVGIGRAAKNGILIKGGSSLEEFAKTKNIVFDKTGTLTNGKFKIKNIHSLNGVSKEEIEAILFKLEQHSSHPIAKSIVQELKTKNVQSKTFSDIKELKGVGVEAKTNDGIIFKVGSFRIASEITKDDSHSLYVVKNNSLAGYVDIEDEIKTNARETISFLKAKNISPILLSGDRKNSCEAIAKKLGIENIYSEQLPEQKLNLIDSFSKKEHTAMVGDGINDAPALTKATVGISIGNATQIAIHSSQIILLNEKDLQQLQTAYLISKHTLKTIKQNLFWAFFYNVIAIPIAAAGFLSPMIGAFAMAFSDVIVIGNSIRLKTKKLN
ncbi:MAG: cadmium-translocating P-type ATPase [Bacteroidetes bacterium]|nr:cadmium-translocating P-type ATPase [Bacteroidota bacterium]